MSVVLFCLLVALGGMLSGLLSVYAFLTYALHRMRKEDLAAATVTEIAPEGPPVPPVTERAVWVVAAADGRYSVHQDEETALAWARQRKGAVARLPLVADYRDDPTPAPTYNSRVVWAGDVERNPMDRVHDAIPPGGPIVIEHQDTEDDGSVTIWFRRVDAG